MASISLYTLVIAFLHIISNGVIADDIMFSGETLETNQILENGPYRLIMQADCNLVLYNVNAALWSSKTSGKGTTCRATLQNNGNLVIFLGTDTVWSSNSASGANNYRLVMQSDGNVVIYGGAVWATNTFQGERRLLSLSNGVIAEDTLFSGETLEPNQFIQNGPYRLIMQADCNLVLYNVDAALWSSRTSGGGTACRATLQNNGNLVISSGTEIVWSSNSARGQRQHRLVLQRDGNLLIYGAAIWATGTATAQRRRRSAPSPTQKNI